MSAELPQSVTIREVGPRDGFQNEPEVLATDVKLRLISQLASSGLRRIELTSFVRADLIPQLADAEQVLSAVRLPPTVTGTVLVPNERGLARALAFRDRFEQISGFLSASESHNQHNLGRPVAESLASLRRTFAAATAEGLRIEAVISTAFGCPYEGWVPPARVLELATELAGAGAVEIAFADTTGMANPLQLQEFFDAAARALPGVELTAHFHNTRGQGLANVLAALQSGVSSFESSFGELGGCPVPAGATGNIATEDLVSMLEQMGVATGVDLELLLQAAAAAQVVLGRRLTSHVLDAGPVDWHRGGGWR